MNLSPQTTARVSRRELALHRYIQLALAVMFAILAASNAIIALAPIGYDRVALLVLAAVFTVVALVFYFTEPAAIGTVENHLVIGATYVGVGAALVAFAPHFTACAAAAAFMGPMIAMKLVDRREITAHLLLATVCLVAPAVYFGVDAFGAIGLGTLVTTVWVLCGCCVMVFEASEAQGEELEDLVRRDPLTCLGNRRILTEQLRAELGRHARTRRPLSILALDLNGFKALNDTLGHAAGDELLRDVATALVDAMRPEDTVVRQGGDEFCIILPNTSPEHAGRAANAVRAALAGCGTGVTCGVGIASYPRDAVHDKVLLHVADERLIEAKAAARGASGAVAAIAASRTSALAIMPTDEPLR